MAKYSWGTHFSHGNICSIRRIAGLFSVLQLVGFVGYLRVLMLAASLLLAAGVSLTEFSCTAGFPVLWVNLVSAQQVQPLDRVSRKPAMADGCHTRKHLIYFYHDTARRNRLWPHHSGDAENGLQVHE